MYCDNCKNDFTEPLQAYDHSRYCPLCLKALQTAGVRVTAENMAAYTQSELLFSQKDYDGALSLCRSAALQENPYAIINMGFYYENGYFPSVSDDARIKSAFEWYDIVARYDAKYRSLRTNSAAPHLAERFDENLTLTAVRNVLCLYLNNPPAGGAFVLDPCFSVPRGNVIKALAETVKVNTRDVTADLSEQPASTSAFYSSFTRDLVMGFRKIQISLLKELASAAHKAETMDLLTRFMVWVRTAAGKTASVGNFANLSGIAADAEKTFGDSFVTIAFCRRDNKKIVYRKKYNGGSISVAVRPNQQSFIQNLDRALTEETFGDSVNLYKNDLIIAKKNDNKEILRLCV